MKNINACMEKNICLFVAEVKKRYQYVSLVEFGDQGTIIAEYVDPESLEIVTLMADSMVEFSLKYLQPVQPRVPAGATIN